MGSLSSYPQRVQNIDQHLHRFTVITQNLMLIRRVVQVAILDTLGMENSIARSRTLAYLAQVALRTLEVGELEERIAALEESIHPENVKRAVPVFEVEQGLLEDGKEEDK